MIRLTLIPSRLRQEEWMREREPALSYIAPVLPQAHSECTRVVIFLQTHLQSKISSLMPQVVLLFPSTLPFLFLIPDVNIRRPRSLSSIEMKDQRISQAVIHQHTQKMCWRCLWKEGIMAPVKNVNTDFHFLLQTIRSC